MRPTLRKLLSAALAAVLLAGALPVYASDALGHDLAVRDTRLNAGTELAAGTFWSDSSSDFRQENYVVYTPSARVSPLVTYGDTTRALTTVPAIARELEERGLRVVAGINGDYYGVAHGVPLGSTISDGVLRNVNHDFYYAVGFRADGTALIGNPNLHIRTQVNGAEGPEIFAFNHVRSSEFGLFLYDHGFNDRHTTGTSEPGVDVVLSCPDGAPALNTTLHMRVEEVLPEATDTAVPEGGYILTANLQAGDAYTAPLLALQPGDELLVTVASEAGGGWNEVRNLVGAPELLVQNGAVVSGLPTGSAPRTAIGQRADGSLIFYTIDGRLSGYSVGATLSMVAMRLVELGCVTAVALDGGGSTTLVATMPDETAARVVNTPSEGSVRAVSNHVFLVAPNTPSGMLDHIYLAPDSVRALPGARVALRAAAVDSNYIPLALGRALSYSASAGSVNADGVLTLPAETGPVTVTASYGGLTASAVVNVVEPDAILFKRNGSTIWSLTMAPGSDVTLSAQGVLNHLALAGGNDCFEWTYEGDGVTLLPDAYTLHAGQDAGAGTLTVSAGGMTATLPVTVAVVPLQTLADFEDPFEPLTDLTDEMLAASPDLKPSLTLSRATDAAHVQFGRAAAKLDYSLSGENAARLPVSYGVGPAYDCVELWVCGDGSETALALETDAGPSAAATLSFSGWKPIALALPSGAQNITAISLTAPGKASGTVWLDQLVLAYDFLVDLHAPEVSLTVDAETNTLTGRAFDAVDGASLPTLRLSCDGAPLEYGFDSRTGALSAILPAPDGLAHHVALTAGDACGNLARASVVIPAAEDAAPAFPDAEGHWAAGAIEFLQRTGVSNGDDRGLYNPDANITRQEFAAMLFRYLTPEDDFSGVELPFADNDDIAAWALDSARAMYALGVVNGSRDDDGKLRYHPQSNITRREAVTMLGRLLEKGYAAPALSYADSADIPDWAAPYVALLGAMGVFDDFVTDAFSPDLPITRAEVAACLLRLN